jgi:hypothetical protein
MIYKQVLTPDEKNHSIEMPKQFFGKKVEVIVVELENTLSETYPAPPKGKEVSMDEIMKTFGTDPEFPTLNEIRTKAWPSKW